MTVVFAIPTYNGTLDTRCVMALVSGFHLLTKKNIDYELLIISNCTYLPAARNTLVSMFMDIADANDLFFIDADVGFDPVSVIKLLERSEGIVAGVYPLKRDVLSFPVKIKTRNGIPIGKYSSRQDCLIEAELLPTGFMRIKRDVIVEMQKAYPELKYKTSNVETDGVIKECWDLFNMGVVKPGAERWTTEDYAFCDRWTSIGGQLWLYPDITFEHVGTKSFKGNYFDYLPKS
mgnify:FL=1